jgi:DNA-binding MarR family transcriptional regulator
MEYDEQGVCDDLMRLLEVFKQATLRLGAQKLVSRQELASDRRTKTLRLTPKGSSVVAGLRAELPAILGCSKLTGHEAIALHAIADKLS